MARLWHALTLASALVVGAGDRALAQPGHPTPLSPPDPSAVLLPPVVPGPVLDRNESDILPASDTALPRVTPTPRPSAPAREPAARIVLDQNQYTPVRTTEYDDSRRSATPPLRREETDDGLAYLTDGLYRRGTNGRATRSSNWEETRRDNEGGLTGLWNKWFGKDDTGRAASKGFGESVGELMNGGAAEGGRRMFESDSAFCDFVSPLSNPFFFEDPRSVTEVRPMFYYQSFPSDDPFFRGGNGWFFGGQGRLAVTQRISLVVHKLGYTSFKPGSGSVYQGGNGLSEFWIGPKVVVYRDPEAKSLISLGTQFQIPLGSPEPLQDTGSLSVVPYVSAAQRLLNTEIGSLNGMASTGYSFSTNNQRSDFYYLSAHLDFDIANGHRFYPVAELNWFSYTTDGKARPVTTEGRDFANVGAAAKGNNLVTWALGMRWRSLNGRFEVGGGYEGFMFGQRGLFDGRFTFDVIWRY
jgi:hypothetical protein